MQWMMLQQDKPEDFVIAGRWCSVRDFINAAATELGMKFTWKGRGRGRIGIDEAGRTRTPAWRLATSAPTEVDAAGRRHLRPARSWAGRRRSASGTGERDGAGRLQSRPSATAGEKKHGYPPSSRTRVSRQP